MWDDDASSSAVGPGGDSSSRDLYHYVHFQASFKTNLATPVHLFFLDRSF